MTNFIPIFPLGIVVYPGENVNLHIFEPRYKQLVKECHDNKIPLTTRGAGTGLSGGALPIEGGVLLSMEKFNKILNIDERNLQATVEPGVINYIFQEEVKKVGLFYPPDPASKGSCFLCTVHHHNGNPLQNH